MTRGLRGVFAFNGEGITTGGSPVAPRPATVAAPLSAPVAAPLPAPMTVDANRCAELPNYGYFHIVNKESNRAIDVVGGDAPATHRTAANASPSNDWFFRNNGNGKYEIVSRKNNQESLFVTSDNQLRLSSTGTPQSQFCFVDVGDGYYKIVSHDTGTSITVAQNDVDQEGSDLVMWSYTGVERQKWRIEAIPFRDDKIRPPTEGSFYIYSKATNKGISLASPESLANVNLSSEPTKFIFRNGHIVAEGLELSLHVARTSRLDNANVLAYLEGNWWASSFSLIEVEHGFYKIVTFTGEKVVEASGTQELANIRQGTFTNAPTQLWRLERADTLECETLTSGDDFRIVSAVDGNFLDVEGRNVITSPAPGSDTLWNFNGNEVVSSLSNKSLNIASANRENSANVIVWDQGNYVNSQWCFVYLGEGNYKIISRYSGRALTAHQNEVSGKRNVLMWDYVGVDRQQWKVRYLPEERTDCATLPSEGVWRIVSSYSDKAISLKENGPLIQVSPAFSEGDQWTFQNKGGGSYEVVSEVNGYSFNIAWGSMDIGAIVIAYQSNNYANSAFCFVDTGNGEYNIVSRFSGHSVEVAGREEADGAYIQVGEYTGNPWQKWKLEKVGSEPLPHRVRVVYIAPSDAPRNNRANLIHAATKEVQRKWSQFGYTFRLDDEVLVFNVDNPCSYFQTEESQLTTRRIARLVDELNLRDPEILNYVSVECSTEVGAVASCSFPQCTNFGRLINWIERGDQNGFGVISHELGHAFGLPHENCDGAADSGTRSYLNDIGVPDYGTNSVMCGIDYFPGETGWPGITAPEPWMEWRMKTSGCRFFWECGGEEPYQKPSV